MMNSSQIADHNRRCWDRLVEDSHALTKAVTADELRDAKQIVDPIGWLEGDVRGRHVLCMAAGGGRFSALFAALGAHVTVVDISAAMLATDDRTAKQFGLRIRAVQSDISSMPMLDDQEFDLIMQPVSTTYLSEPRFAFAEASRVLKPGGLYISFHKQPMNLQAALQCSSNGYMIERPVDAVIHNPSDQRHRLREAGAIEHAHSLQVLIGGICKSGFVIEDVTEPKYGDLTDAQGSFAHRCAFIPPYIAIKARRTQSTVAAKPPRILTLPS
jgi:ubiquinone/menaquinone biosynthesis C-methylase UbiE